MPLVSCSGARVQSADEGLMVDESSCLFHFLFSKVLLDHQATRVHDGRERELRRGPGLVCLSHSIIFHSVRSYRLLLLVLLHQRNQSKFVCVFRQRKCVFRRRGKESVLNSPRPAFKKGIDHFT